MVDHFIESLEHHQVLASFVGAVFVFAFIVMLTSAGPRYTLVKYQNGETQMVDAQGKVVTNSEGITWYNQVWAKAK